MIFRPNIFKGLGILGKEEKLNQYGFRGPIIDSEKKILFAGCSMTYGQGVEYHQTFANQTTNKLGKEWSCLNTGIPGSGPDIQITAISWALNAFKIDKICWLMSDPIRTTITLNNNQDIKFCPSMDYEVYLDQNIKKDVIKFTENHLYFEKNYLTKLKHNIYTLFSLIKEKNIECFVTCWVDDFDNELQELKDMFNVKPLGTIDWLDKGSDDNHPGPISHAEFAERIFNRIHI